jgi:hypothetical protein
MPYPELPSPSSRCLVAFVHNSVLKGQALVCQAYEVPHRRPSAHLYGAKVKVEKGQKVTLKKALITRQNRRICGVPSSRLVVFGVIANR